MPAQNLPDLILDQAHPLSRGLVGWWPMNEGGGERVNDISGNALTGTFTNIVQGTSSGWTGGPPHGGGSVLMDQTNDYILVNHSPKLAILGEISVCAWVWFTGNPSGYPAIQKGGGYPNPYGLSSQPDRKWNFVRGNGASQSYVLGNTSIPVQTWGLVVGSWANGLFSIYINGRLDNTAAGTPAVADSGSGLGIGSQYPIAAGNQFMYGRIANVRIYNRALSAAEVAQLYAEPMAGARVPVGAIRYFVPPPAAIAAPPTADRLWNRGYGGRTFRRGVKGS